MSTYEEGGKGPWRITAVFSGFKTREAAQLVEESWKQARKLKLPNRSYHSGRYSPPESSVWNLLPTVLRRIQQVRHAPARQLNRLTD